MESTNQISWSKVRTRLVLITFILAVCAGASRFIVLANIGAQGSEVSRIRAQKESIRLENETLRAKIDGVRTLAQIEEGINQVYGGNLHQVSPRQITTSSVEDFGLLSLSTNE